VQGGHSHTGDRYVGPAGGVDGDVAQNTSASNPRYITLNYIIRLANA
jgi:hypothetical protein